MIATAISEAMSPYSIAVTPLSESSENQPLTVFLMLFIKIRISPAFLKLGNNNNYLGGQPPVGQSVPTP
jgi:hypothetical protein